MLFNSIDFAVFLPIVFCLYWFVFNKNIRHQNALLAAASYVFYGWWDWRFLSLILFSTLVDFLVGRALLYQDSDKKRKTLLTLSIVVNLGLLGFFKYSNFFIENFNAAFTLFGNELNISTLSIVLPVGISFYTFQTLSYTIDVYKRKLSPTNDVVAFAAFVSFFPQLVAGPIERATNLLPQFSHRRVFDYHLASDGMRQMLWGLFKKVVIADNCAEMANYIFANSSELHSSTLILGALFFTFQIYGDFSGYSDIAIGVSRLFGFDLMKNFAFPYFSRDIAEFWRRWHISLSTWFRDYLYIPLGGSRGGLINRIRNIFIIFLVSGFWHGANWTFVVWGGLNALYFLPLMLTKSNRKNMGVVAEQASLPSFRELAMMVVTFSLTVFAWIFFRADSIRHALSYISGMFRGGLFEIPSLPDLSTAFCTLVLISVLMVVEWFGRKDEHALQRLISGWKKPMRIMVYCGLGLTIYLFAGRSQEFIYFQF